MSLETQGTPISQVVPQVPQTGGVPLSPPPVEQVPQSDAAAPVEQKNGLRAAIEQAQAKLSGQGQPRDPQGRFAALVSEAGQEPASEGAAPEGDAQETVEAPAWTDGHFRGWSPEDRARFESLPVEAQAFVMDRQQQSQAVFTRQQQAIQNLSPYAEVVERNADYFGRFDAPQHQIIQNIIDVDRVLSTGSYNERVNLLTKLSHDYGVPMVPAMPQDQSNPTNPHAPGYAELLEAQTQAAQYRAHLEMMQRQQQQMQEQQAIYQFNVTLQEMAAAKTPDGRTQYPYFNEVKETMLSLMASGRVQDLQDAYAIAARPLDEMARKLVQQPARISTGQPVRTTAPGAPGGQSEPRGLRAHILAAARGAGQ